MTPSSKVLGVVDKIANADSPDRFAESLAELLELYTEECWEALAICQESWTDDQQAGRPWRTLARKLGSVEYQLRDFAQRVRRFT